MYLKGIELSGFKSFVKKTELEFVSPIAGIVGPNGSGKSNIAEAFRFVLGEQSFKSMRGKRGEDLIWGGSQSVPRANRASVKAVFDNSTRLFDIDFDEVSIERTVHRDGVNQYAINNSHVRLKDISALLAGANIGSTGHHIISQGEADRLLSAHIRERREMIEDALGLKVFQYKKKESERKLEQTRENIERVTSLRREIAPHLKFLKRQVEKIEKSKRLRDELGEMLREYLKREEIYVKHRKEKIVLERKDPETELLKFEQELRRARAVLERGVSTDSRGKEVLQTEKDLSDIKKEREELAREIGRLEGQISFAQKHTEIALGGTVALSDVRRLSDEIEEAVTEAEHTGSASSLQEGLSRVRSILRVFFERHRETERVDKAADLTLLQKEKDALTLRFENVLRKEEESGRKYRELKDEIENAKDESREAEREVFRIAAEKSRVEGILHDLARDEEELNQLEAEFKRNVEEGAMLVGRHVLSYDTYVVEKEAVLKESRDKQEERRRTIEKVKIRVEEIGGGSSEEVLKEYREANERDQFLEHEVNDLEGSSETLRGLISELDERLAVQFREGISKINKEFQHFFELLFGGGNASLQVIEQKRRKRTGAFSKEGDEEEEGEGEEESGIDIAVSLPRKKIKGLQMLSGGERALTSIALLFAMSQVNPPPFLILDETDAALDEANSRKYSAMIKELSKKTQLILITHNRETMSTAGVLYGVTMGADGVSKLLSVKFEEAVAVAK